MVVPMQDFCTKKLNMLQSKLAEQVSIQNNFTMKDIRTVAGVDVAYWSKQDTEYGSCCISVIDYETKIVVEEAHYIGEVDFPYIAGYLAFRDLPLIINAVEKLTIQSDLFMFDGNGYLHSRHMGIATQASFVLGKPTIGVAKTYLKIGNIDFVMPENRVGAYTGIEINDELFGGL